MISLERLKTKIGTIWASKYSKKLVLIYSKQWGAYWRDNGMGYTQYLDRAGIYTLEEALRYSQHCSPEKGINYQPIPKQIPRNNYQTKEFPRVGFLMLEGTEWDEEKLNLVLLVNRELNTILRIDLLNSSVNFLNIPENGIPKHFKEINKDRLNELFVLYFNK